MHTNRRYKYLGLSFGLGLNNLLGLCEGLFLHIQAWGENPCLHLLTFCSLFKLLLPLLHHRNFPLPQGPHKLIIRRRLASPNTENLSPFSLDSCLIFIFWLVFLRALGCTYLHSMFSHPLPWSTTTARLINIWAGDQKPTAHGSNPNSAHSCK